MIYLDSLPKVFPNAAQVQLDPHISKTNPLLNQQNGLTDHENSPASQAILDMQGWVWSNLPQDSNWMNDLLGVEESDESI